MKLIILFFAFSISASCMWAKVPTPSAVSSFYDNMKRLSKAENSRESDKIVRSLWKLSYAKQKGIASGGSMRNDFQRFVYDRPFPFHEDNTLNFDIYIDKLEQYCFVDKVMEVDYLVLNNDYYGGVIEFNKGKILSQNTIIETIVEKTYTINHQKITLRDTLLTDIPTNTICKFYNIKDVDEKDIADLKKQAARYYYLELYSDAYKCFEKILSINPKDGEALYRLGLMTYYARGCSFFSKSVQHSKGKDYMIRASQSDVVYGFRDKADIVLKNWKYGPGLM